MKILEIVGGGVNRTTVDGRTVSDKDDTLDNILKTAGLLDETDNTKIKADASGNRPTGFLVKKPDGSSEFISVDSTTGAYTDGSGSPAGSTPIPKGTIITSKNPTNPNNSIITFTFNYGTDAAGKPYEITVPMEVTNGTTATWADIQAEATKNGINLFPAGYTLKTLNNNPSPNGADILNSANKIGIVFEKDINYKVNVGKTKGSVAVDYPVTITYPDQEALSLKDILTKAGAPSSGGKITDAPKSAKPDNKDLASGWIVTVPGKAPIIVSSKDINDGTGAASGKFPPGTIIEPNWIENGQGGALGGTKRTLSSGSGNVPSKGDSVTDKGNIFPKGTPITDGGKVLGYIYAVDTAKKTVNVVSKDIATDKRWAANTNNKVYSGVNTDSSSNTDITKPNLREWMTNVSSGYDTWTSKITKWNKTAEYNNYEAIKLALCYPRTFGTNTESLPTDNAGVDAIVNGSSWSERWYLPSIDELKKIYDARADLINWKSESELGIKSFWSVNVSTDTTVANVDNCAQYITFNGDNAPQITNADKNGTKVCVLSVALFNYKD